MEITVTEQGPVVIARVAGRMDSATSPSAQEELLAAVKGDVKMALDMSACEFVSSAGLRALLLVAKNVVKGNGRIVLAGLAREVQDIMEMTGFDKMFVNTANINEAVGLLTKENA